MTVLSTGGSSWPSAQVVSTLHQTSTFLVPRSKLYNSIPEGGDIFGCCPSVCCVVLRWKELQRQEGACMVGPLERVVLLCISSVLLI